MLTMCVPDPDPGLGLDHLERQSTTFVPHLGLDLGLGLDPEWELRMSIVLRQMYLGLSRLFDWKMGWERSCLRAAWSS